MDNNFLAPLAAVAFVSVVALYGLDLCIRVLRMLSKRRPTAVRREVNILPAEEQRISFESAKPPVWHVIYTRCHPQANGRQPAEDEMGWTFTAHLDSGAILKLNMGRHGRDAMLAMLLREHADDIADAMGRSPAYDCHQG